MGGDEMSKELIDLIEFIVGCVLAGWWVWVLFGRD